MPSSMSTVKTLIHANFFTSPPIGIQRCLKRKVGFTLFQAYKSATVPNAKEAHAYAISQWLKPKIPLVNNKTNASAIIAMRKPKFLMKTGTVIFFVVAAAETLIEKAIPLTIKRLR